MEEKNFLIKLGFTTKTFMKAGNKGLITDEESIRWAVDKGFSWIELRDDNIKMDTDYLKRMAAIARELGVRIHYAWDGSDLLEKEDENKLLLGLKNAQIFGEGGYSRLTIAKSAFNNTNKKGYDKEEFEKLCKIINRYESISKNYGIALVYENSVESVEGDGSSFFGMRELMTECKEMKMTFDMGNFTNKNQVIEISSSEQIKKLFSDFKNRIPYIHLKVTKENILQDKLIEEADVDFDFFIKECSKDSLLCIELPGLDDLEKCKSNVESSLKLLTNKYQ